MHPPSNSNFWWYPKEPTWFNARRFPLKQTMDNGLWGKGSQQPLDQDQRWVKHTRNEWMAELRIIASAKWAGPGMIGDEDENESHFLISLSLYLFFIFIFLFWFVNLGHKWRVQNSYFLILCTMLDLAWLGHKLVSGNVPSPLYYGIAFLGIKLSWKSKEVGWGKSIFELCSFQWRKNIALTLCLDRKRNRKERNKREEK